MHEFAVVVLLGLAVYAVVTLVGRLSAIQVRGGAALSILMPLAFGVVTALVTDYSLFAQWGIALRAGWMGPVATGLVIGAAAMLWQEAIAALSAYGHRAGAAGDAETRRPRSGAARPA